MTRKIANQDDNLAGEAWKASSYIEQRTTALMRTSKKLWRIKVLK